MSKEKYKPLMPDLMEAIFDAAYLTFDLLPESCFLYFPKEIRCLSCTVY